MSAQDYSDERKLKILFCALWIAHPVLQTAIAIVMLRRGQHRQHKWFFAYILAQIPIFAAVFPTYWYHHYSYFYVSSFTTAISVALGFGLIYDAFVDVFRPFNAWRDLGIIIFKWAVLVMLLVAGVISVSSNSPHVPPVAQAIDTVQRCVRIIQVGLVLFLLILARYLGVSRRHRSFGIALGFGTFAAVELGLIATWAGYNLNETWVGVINTVGYNSALIIWLGYALAETPVREPASTLPRPQRWEQTLTDLHYPPTPDSSIPGSPIPVFDAIVDWDPSRTQVAPPSTIYRELNLLETELSENIKALKFTSTQISRRLGRLSMLARNPRSGDKNSGDA